MGLCLSWPYWADSAGDQCVRTSSCLTSCSLKECLTYSARAMCFHETKPSLPFRRGAMQESSCFLWTKQVSGANHLLLTPSSFWYQSCGSHSHRARGSLCRYKRWSNGRWISGYCESTSSRPNKQGLRNPNTVILTLLNSLKLCASSLRIASRVNCLRGIGPQRQKRSSLPLHLNSCSFKCSGRQQFINMRDWTHCTFHFKLPKNTKVYNIQDLVSFAGLKAL